MRCSRHNLRSPRILLVTVCAAAVVLLAACGSSGEPTSYTDTDTVETNFTNGCEKAAEADPAIRPAAEQYCACAYSRLVTEISFDDFKQLDDDVKDDPEKIRGGDDDEDSTATTLNAIFDDCRAAHARG